MTDWASGVYQWDGAGNVTKMGSARFLYDGVSRLKSAEISLAPAGGGTLAQQGYSVCGTAARILKFPCRC